MSIRLEKIISVVALVLVMLAGVIVVMNQYPTLAHLEPKFRITTGALCLIFTLVTTAINPRAGAVGFIFALPLQPTLAWQIQQYFGYGRILGTDNAGFDLVAGFFLGIIIYSVRSKRRLNETFEIPWPVGLAMLLISLSTLVAISRNLHQTASLFRVDVLLYNLAHFRSLGWHDDYRPLFDWIAYGCAFLTLAAMLPILKASTKRNEIVFIPLIASLTIAAVVGLRQSFYGIGLSKEQINFRFEQFGYIALGFQNDIHAFAGQMLIGALGLFGYLYYLKNGFWRLTLLFTVIPLSWFALFRSKSKTSFALALLTLVVLGVVWWLRRKKYSVRLGWTVVGTLSFAILFLLFFHEAAIALSVKILHLAGIHDLRALDYALSYRPDVYAGGLRMFSQFPWFGMGQSEFYRQSANHDLTRSYFLSIQQNGENGHNYFLQTLVETGLIGGVIFLIMLLYPVFKITDKRALIPAILGLGSIFIGNIFAHSLLVRENLIIAAVLLALMYATALTSKDSPAVSSGASKLSQLRINTPLVNYAFVLVSLFALVGAWLESNKAKTSFPFTFDTQCYKPRPIDQDGWTSGLLEMPLAPEVKQITINLKPGQPILDHRPLNIEVSVRDSASMLIFSETLLLSATSPRSYSVEIPQNDKSETKNKALSIKLARCFIPRNLGINEDGRRLGIQLESITTSH
jgi:O-antigen ligase